MKTMRTRKTQPPQLNKSVFLFHRYGIHQHGPKTLGASYEAREIGKIMALKVAKKLKLNLDVQFNDK